MRMGSPRGKKAALIYGGELPVLIPFAA